MCLDLVRPLDIKNITITRNAYYIRIITLYPDINFNTKKNYSKQPKLELLLASAFLILISYLIEILEILLESFQAYL